MLYYLGCDVAKQKVDVSLIDQNGRELFFGVARNECAELAQYIASIHGQLLETGDQLCCIVESTSTYHYATCEAAIAIGHTARVYNPLLTKQALRASVRGKKTDRTDALVIARLGQRGEGYPYLPGMYSVTKQYVRSYQKLGEMHTAAKLHGTHVDNQLSEVVTKTNQDSVQAALTGIQIAIQAARKRLYVELLSSAQGNTFTLLQTIPGVGPYVAASCLGEIGDIQRFKNAHALVAYAGLDPKIRQSGKSLNSTGKLTKRGSSYLRRSLFIAANVARQHDPVFKALYDKKRDEGKSYTVAICVVARKLLGVVRAVWLHEREYDVNFKQD